MIILYCFFKFKRCKVVQVKLASLKLDFLLHAWIHTNLLDIVISIRCIEHFWGVVNVSFLCNTCVDSNMSLSLRIDLERQLELEIISNSLKWTNQISCQEKHVEN